MDSTLINKYLPASDLNSDTSGDSDSYDPDYGNPDVWLSEGGGNGGGGNGDGLPGTDVTLNQNVASLLTQTDGLFDAQNDAFTTDANSNAPANGGQSSSNTTIDQLIASLPARDAANKQALATATDSLTTISGGGTNTNLTIDSSGNSDFTFATGSSSDASVIAGLDPTGTSPTSTASAPTASSGPLGTPAGTNFVFDSEGMLVPTPNLTTGVTKYTLGIETTPPGWSVSIGDVKLGFETANVNFSPGSLATTDVSGAPLYSTGVDYDSVTSIYITFWSGRVNVVTWTQPEYSGWSNQWGGMPVTDSGSRQFSFFTNPGISLSREGSMGSVSTGLTFTSDGDKVPLASVDIGPLGGVAIVARPKNLDGTH